MGYPLKIKIHRDDGNTVLIGCVFWDNEWSGGLFDENGTLQQIDWYSTLQRAKTRYLFTGVKDKNGKDIYEGDRVKWKSHSGAEGEGKVWWNPKTAGWVFGSVLLPDIKEMTLMEESYA